MELTESLLDKRPAAAADVNLFSPLTLRGITFRNRIGVSPMCQYSSEDGFATDWHLVHLGSRAVGGAGLVMVEATAVEARGRISPADLGIWKDGHIPNLARIAAFLKSQGAVPGIQLAHAGRKGSTDLPWRGGAALLPEAGGWQTVAPSPIPFRDSDPTPAELRHDEIPGIVNAFAEGAQRALEAGFEVIEIHSAHGYLINEFLSPLSNRRGDEYGGSFDNRIRFLLEATEAIRGVWPGSLPLFLRISAQDWVEGGWTLQDSIELARHVKSLGVDLVDASSGGLVPYAKIELGPGYQVPFAEAIRREAAVPTAAVGLITDPKQADSIVGQGQADLVLLAREFLRDPYWPLHSAKRLEAKIDVPVQYRRAFL